MKRYFFLLVIPLVLFSCSKEGGGNCDSRLFDMDYTQNSGFAGPYLDLILNSDGTFSANFGTNTGTWSCNGGSIVTSETIVGITTKYKFENISFTNDSTWTTDITQQIAGTNTPLGTATYTK